MLIKQIHIKMVFFISLTFHRIMLMILLENPQCLLSNLIMLTESSFIKECRHKKYATVFYDYVDGLYSVIQMNTCPLGSSYYYMEISSILFIRYSLYTWNRLLHKTLSLLKCQNEGVLTFSFKTIILFYYKYRNP